MNDETLTFYGGEIKALGDGRIGGYLVRFGDADKTDLEGEFFTRDTDFDLEIGEVNRTSVYYHHGLDPVIKQRKIGTGEVRYADDVGLWVEAQLEIRDQYESAIYDMVKTGKLGWSSGTAPHLMAKSAGHITRWPIVEASITPTPAEPRAHAVAVKALSSPTAGPVEVCAYLSELTAQTLAMMPEVATPADDLRITIANFDALTAIESAWLVAIIGEIVEESPDMGGDLSGVGWSHSVGSEVDVIYAIPNIRGLDDIRTKILHKMGVATSAEQLPYARLAIADADGPMPNINRRQFPMPVSLSALTTLADGERTDYSFTALGTATSTALEPEAEPEGEAVTPEDARTASAPVPESEAMALEIDLLELERTLVQ